MEYQEDRVWLKALSHSNEEAYCFLFKRYYYALYSFACKYLKDHDLAEDMVQDVLYELLIDTQKFDSIISLKSYLYTSVRNKCLNVIKRFEVKQKYLTEIIGQEPDFFLNRILEEEVYALLKQAILELPEQTCKVYKLVVLGLDNRDIAKELEISEDAVKAHRKRGKKLLKEKLQNLMSINPVLISLMNIL